MFGGLPYGMLERIGITRSMIDKCPTLFFKNAFEKLKQYLGTFNIKDVYYKKVDNKYYLYFNFKFCLGEAEK